MFVYKQYYPTAALAELVECYWILQSNGDFMPVPDRLIPGGRVELMFNLGEPAQWLMQPGETCGSTMQGAFIMGQRNKIFYAQGNGKAHIIGLRFKPGGLAAFTNMPVSALLNSVVQAEDIFGAGINNWPALLFEETEHTGKITLLERLLQQAIQGHPVDKAIMQYAMHMLRSSDDTTNIKTICDATGWYYKKLERLFLKNTGYTPKYYGKITRFNKALRLMQGNSTLTHVCYECNYFDQSHFIKDFYQFAGMAPKQFKQADNRIASLLIQHQPV